VDSSLLDAERGAVRSVYAELLVVQLELRLAAHSWNGSSSSITAMCIDLEEVESLTSNTSSGSGPSGGLQPLLERWAAVKETVQHRLSETLDQHADAHDSARSSSGGGQRRQHHDNSMLADLTAQADSFGA
jgi:hypothetical protein